MNKNFWNRLLGRLIIGLFVLLLVVWSLVLPIIAYNLGADNQGASIPRFLVFGFGLIMLWGWLLVAKHFIAHIAMWTFDVGCGWAQYLDTKHYASKGELKNTRLYSEGRDLIFRSQILLDDYYMDSKFTRTESHGESVAILMGKTNKSN